MTISQYARTADLDGLPLGGRGAGRRYRDRKRDQAQDRQQAHDAEVARVARDHNVSESEARRVVNARRRHEHRAGAR